MLSYGNISLQHGKLTPHPFNKRIHLQELTYDTLQKVNLEEVQEHIKYLMYFQKNVGKSGGVWGKICIFDIELTHY